MISSVYTQLSLRSTKCACVLLLLVWLAGKKSYVMKGPNDDQLVWPLEGHSEVKLLNQISNSEHHWGLIGRYWEYKSMKVRPANITNDIVIGSLVKITCTIWHVITSCMMSSSCKYLTIDNLHNCLYTCCYHHVHHMWPGQRK